MVESTPQCFYTYIFGQSCLVELDTWGERMLAIIAMWRFCEVLLYIISISNGLNMLLVEGSISECGKRYVDVIIVGRGRNQGVSLEVVVLVLTSL